RAGHGGRADPAVDLEVDVAAGDLDHRRDLGDLRLHRRQVVLAAEAGVDGHDQHQVDQVHDVGDRGGGRRGVQRHRGAGTQLADVAERAVQVGAGLGVHDHDLATRLDVAVRQLVGVHHHEVGLEGDVDVRPTGPDHVRPEGE